MDVDKILEIIQRKVLKGTHLPITVKEIQAGYLNSPYFKDLYLYLVSEQIVQQEKCHMQGRDTSGKIHPSTLFVI